MALQTGLFKVTGRLDNVIGYRRNGKHFFRSMPHKVRQTSATRQAARRFGMASRKGKLIRQAFRPYLDMRYDGTIVNRLNKLLVQSGVHNIQALRNFHFNRHAGTEKFFVLPPVFTADGTLTIPAQELPEHKLYITHLEIRLIATRIDLAAHRVLHTHSDTAVVDLRQPFNGLKLNVPVNGNGTLFFVLQCRVSIHCNGELCHSGDRRYMAADLISVVPPVAPTSAVTLRTKRSSIPAIAGANRYSATAVARSHGFSSATIAGSNGSSSTVIIRANGSSSSVIARSRKAKRVGRRSNLPPPVFPSQLE